MSKQQILERIRHSLKRRQPLDASVVGALEQRLAERRPLVQPAYDEDLVDRLLRKHEALHGSCERVAGPGQLAAAVAGYLSGRGLPPRLVAGDHQLIRSLDFGAAVTVEYRGAVGDDVAALSVADLAVAETGTLAIFSSAASPMTHHYLPEHHLVIVRESDVVKWQETVWERLRTGGNWPPRGIALISGPSKTADVEQTIEYGAHGPRNVHLLLLGAGEA